MTQFKLILFLLVLLNGFFSNSISIEDSVTSEVSRMTAGSSLVEWVEPGKLRELGGPITEKEFIEAISLVDIPETDSRAAVDPNLYEGDIRLVRNRNAQPLQSAIKDPKYRWPGAIMPYVISAEFNEKERIIIARAMAEIMKVTCISIKGKTSERDFIKIYKGQGCSSSVGRVGGEQLLSLGNGCIYSGIVQHELMHALGFWHEQSRPDRDDFVTILRDNIIPNLKYNFNKKSASLTKDLGLSYDYNSIMHYGEYDFTKNGKPTILPKQRGVTVGQRKSLSTLDTKGLNLLYKCDSTPITTPRPIVTSTAQPESCVDISGNCEYWSKKGFCRSSIYRQSMDKNCRLTCGKCKPSLCQDKKIYCPYWSRRGSCHRNPGYMKITCPKSCNVCK